MLQSRYGGGLLAVLLLLWGLAVIPAVPSHDGLARGLLLLLIVRVVAVIRVIVLAPSATPIPHPSLISVLERDLLLCSGDMRVVHVGDFVAITSPPRRQPPHR